MSSKNKNDSVNNERTNEWIITSQYLSNLWLLVRFKKFLHNKCFALRRYIRKVNIRQEFLETRRKVSKMHSLPIVKCIESFEPFGNFS